MKLAIAQTRPVPGNVEHNLKQHLALASVAVAHGCRLIAFPELSLTGYEPSLAAELAMQANDERLGRFQELSDDNGIVLAVGLPLRSNEGVQIGMAIFQANQPVQTYAKQHLHADELPFFVPGNKAFSFQIDNLKVVPAICYESLLSGFMQKAADSGADIYLASVAKTASGIEQAHVTFSQASHQHQMAILLSNCTGPNDGVVSGGKSAIWDVRGNILGELDDSGKGILVWNRKSNLCQTVTI